MINSTTKKIVFYKERNFGQRILAALDFFQSNFVILFKNTFKIGIPVLLVYSFLMNNMINPLMQDEVQSSSFFIYGVAWLICYTLGVSLMNSGLASMMILSQEGLLKKQTKVSEFNNLLSFTSKSFIILFVSVAILAIIMVGAVYTNNVWVIVFASLLVLFLIPFTGLMSFPVYFEDKDVVESMSKGIKLGWKYWGTTAFMMLVLTCFSAALNYFFAIPMYLGIAISAALSGSETAGAGASIASGIISYICIFIGSLSMLLITPISFICMAFQYFAVREEQDGMSLKLKIDEFESL